MISADQANHLKSPNVYDIQKESASVLSVFEVVFRSFVQSILAQVSKQLLAGSGLVKASVLLLWFLLWGSPTAAVSSQQLQPGKPVNIPPKHSGSEEVERSSVKMDFQDVDIHDFIRYVGEMTGKNFIVGPNVKGRITLVSPNMVPMEEVFSVFLSVLEVHGYTTVEAGSVVKIVPSAAARSKGVETGFMEKSGTAEDKFVTKVLYLNYLSPDDAKTMLTPLMSKDSSIVSHPRSGTLIVTDYLFNIERLRRIIEAMDVPGSREEISVIGD
jgi:general secretion pathway protein D